MTKNMGCVIISWVKWEHQEPDIKTLKWNQTNEMNYHHISWDLNIRNQMMSVVLKNEKYYFQNVWGAVTVFEF